MAGRFPQRFHPAGLNALATSSVTRPALVRVSSSRRVLIKIGFGGGRATLSYCDWRGTGPKFFSNHSRRSSPVVQESQEGRGFPATTLPRQPGREALGKPQKRRLVQIKRPAPRVKPPPRRAHGRAVSAAARGRLPLLSPFLALRWEWLKRGGQMKGRVTLGRAGDGRAASEFNGSEDGARFLSRWDRRCRAR